jgi:hypothetical protein
MSGHRGCGKERAPLVRAGLFKSNLSSAQAYFFGAEESALLEDFDDFFLWLCFLACFAGADAEVSEEGAAVSAANTGPAASSSRLTTGTSFLNIDRLHM